MTITDGQIVNSPCAQLKRQTRGTCQAALSGSDSFASQTRCLPATSHCLEPKPSIALYSLTVSNCKDVVTYRHSARAVLPGGNNHLAFFCNIANTLPRQGLRPHTGRRFVLATYLVADVPRPSGTLGAFHVGHKQQRSTQQRQVVSKVIDTRFQTIRGRTASRLSSSIHAFSNTSKIKLQRGRR